MIGQYMPLIVIWLILSFIYTQSHIGQALQRTDFPLHFIEDDKTGERFAKGLLLCIIIIIAWALVSLLMPGIILVFILEQTGILNIFKSLKNKIKRS